MRGCLSDPFAITWTYFIFTLTDIRDSTAVHERKWIPTCSHFLVHLPAGNTFRNWMREDGFLPFSHFLLFPAPDFVSHTPPSRLTFWRHFESQQIGSKEATYCKMQRLCQSWSDLSTGKRQVLVKTASQSSPCDEEMPSLKVWGGVCVCGGRQK